MPQFELITPEAYAELKQMVIDVTGLYQQAKKERDRLKNKIVLSAAEAAELTPWKKETLIAHKAEIGYISKGKEILFERSKIEAWLFKDEIKPRLSRTGRN